MHLRSLPIVGLGFLVALGSPANAAIGAWVAGDHFQVRLLASAMADGRPAAALEFAIDPGWKIYWRTPGETGLPTVLDFDGSWNLAEAGVGYPAPQRYDDGISVSNVYENRVVLPIAIRAAFGGAPITLAVRASLGICETICIPAEITTSLVVPAGPDPAVQALIQVAQASVPGPPQPGVQEVLAIEPLPSPDDQVQFLARILTPAPDATEVFVEGPEGWIAAPTAPISRDGNIISVSFGFDRLALAAELDTVTLTVVAKGNLGSRAIEQRLPLPAIPSP